MATVLNHVQIGIVDNAGNVNILYPINTADDVSVDRSKNNSLPSVKNLQELINNFGAMAFDEGTDLVHISTAEDYSGESPNSEINDNITSASYTWSSNKLNTHVERFIPTKDIALTDISALPITAVQFVVNGNSNTFAALCPATGYYWFVEYIPVVTSASQKAGYPGGANTISMARQVWTGYKFNNPSETPVKYERIYMNGDWQSFHSVS